MSFLYTLRYHLALLCGLVGVLAFTHLLAWWSYSTPCGKDGLSRSVCGLERDLQTLFCSFVLPLCLVPIVVGTIKDSFAGTHSSKPQTTMSASLYRAAIQAKASTGAPLPYGLLRERRAPTLCCGVDQYQGPVLLCGTHEQGESDFFDDLIVAWLQMRTFRKKGICVTFKLRRQGARYCWPMLYHVHLRRKPAKDSECERRVRALVEGMRVKADVHSWGVSGLVSSTIEWCAKAGCGRSIRPQAIYENESNFIVCRKCERKYCHPCGRKEAEYLAPRNGVDYTNSGYNGEYGLTKPVMLYVLRFCQQCGVATPKTSPFTMDFLPRVQ